MISLNLDKHLPNWVDTHGCGTDMAPTLTSNSSSSTLGNEMPVPKDMDELVRLIRAELGIYGLDSDQVNVSRVMTLMSNYTSNASDWEKYAHFDPTRYTRNLVDDGNGEFNLLVLAWGKDHQSSIHDHAGSHCVMKILDGELNESQYNWPDASQTEMIEAKRTIYTRDEVTYISDKIGLHRVANRSGTNALSLHLYTPPIKQAVTFVESTAEPRCAGTCAFYSIRGEKVSL